MFVAGITDATAGADESSVLRGDVGWGPRATTPDDSWEWSAAVPNPAWVDTAEPGNDEYLATFLLPAPGSYDFAFRFTVDDGATWEYCDRWVDADSDGSADGYSPSAAGVINTVGPCDVADACPPAARTECASETTVLVHTPPTCTADGAAAICDYGEEEVPCALGDVCLLGACVPDRVEVGWCRLQHPAQIEQAPGGSFDAYARLYVAGVTPRTSGVDVDDHIVVEIGLGDDGSSPDTGWSWVAASANAEWDAAAAGEVGNDEYQAVVTAPTTAGDYDLAARVSGDRGATWTLCDLGRGVGADGSENGYSAADAGSVTVVEPVDPCEPNPCYEPAVRGCDGDQVVESEADGVCTVELDGAICDYGSVLVHDCAADGFACLAGECISGLDAPAPGELVISELMARTSDADGLGVWFELESAADHAVELDGCELLSGGASVTVVGPLVVAAGDRVVVAPTDASSADGGVDADVVFPGFAGGPEGFVTVRCGTTVVDTVTWQIGDTTLDTATQLSSDRVDADVNDVRVYWCDADAAYAVDRLGTPGAENRMCPDVTHVIDWCGLQWPLSLSLIQGDAAVVYGRLYVPGLTTLTPVIDPDPFLVAQVGVGPTATRDATWTWFAAPPNALWDGSTLGAPNDDEYAGTLIAPAARVADYAYGYRFSGDGGLTWHDCDGTGALHVDAPLDPCAPNPCVVPPVGTCDGGIGRHVEAAGACAVPGPTCDYTFEEEDCAVSGGICIEGYCAAAPPVAVGWCRLQYPQSARTAAGESTTVYGRVWVSGLTDVSPAVDRYPALRAQLGVGPVNADPRTAPLAYAWTEASPNSFWNGDAAGEPNNDEYEASLVASTAGTYRYVYRFSGDGGATWLVCDGGAAGSADGYQVEQTGVYVAE
ncbi:MAG: hypothetical protein H6699_08410 [Myxococcales bacterium]|nr:hypothetical protein [Myxococcales bacterium]